MRYQLLLDKDLDFDLKEYCKDNSLDRQEVIRHLIRTEVYQEQSLAKKIKPKK